MNGFDAIKGYEDWKALTQEERNFYFFMAIDKLGTRIGKVEKIVFSGVGIILTAFLVSLTTTFIL